MTTRNHILILIFILFARPDINAMRPDLSSYVTKDSGFFQDSLFKNQILYNGRLWRNIYLNLVKSDQFLFSGENMPGSLTLRGRTFDSIKIWYDIYNDEIIIQNKNGNNIQLNKEMVDSFSFSYSDVLYHFINIRADTTRGFNGYLNQLYKGKSSLLVKYQKKIDVLGYEGTTDQFEQFHHIYIVLDKGINRISRKRDIYNLFGEHKDQVKSHVKKNRLGVSVDYPETIIPLLEYYDMLRR